MEPRGVMANQIRHGVPIQKLAGQVLIEPLAFLPGFARPNQVITELIVTLYTQLVNALVLFYKCVCLIRDLDPKSIFPHLL